MSIVYVFTSNVEEKAGTTAMGTDAEHFQNVSLLYVGPIRDPTMGKALCKAMIRN